MNQTLEQLIKLQDIDQRLMKIKEHMGDLPDTVESQESEIESLKEDNQEKQEGLSEIEKNIRHQVSEIEDFTTKLEKYKEQLFLVKSNKEYDAISQEIDHMKSTIADSETMQFTFEEKKSELGENIKLNTTKIERITESLTSNQTELDVAMAETTHEQKELESNRDILYKDIEPKYLDAYEILRNARNIGMASIIGPACGGCYSQLPPQTIIEIKENKHIITCPNCSVFQFWDGAEEF
jgi:predicted  nucleic acid-binding Zn-ribbon protein